MPHEFWFKYYNERRRGGALEHVALSDFREGNVTLRTRKMTQSRTWHDIHHRSNSERISSLESSDNLPIMRWCGDVREWDECISGINTQAITSRFIACKRQS